MIIVAGVFSFGLLHRRDTYITLEEVIPAGEVISREEGLVRYKGVKYVLGTNDLREKKRLIEKLSLSGIEQTLVVDFSYEGQIIIRAKKGS